MTLVLAAATEADAEALAELRAAVAESLTRAHGKGHWSSPGTVKGVRRGLRTSRVLLARDNSRVLGTLGLATRKPWAIAPEYFTPVPRALYLVDLAVAPAAQGRGIGRVLIEEAERVARAWPADAIRLDAYDSPAGAGPFYAKLGFREVGRVVYRGTPLIYYEHLLTGPAAREG